MDAYFYTGVDADVAIIFLVFRHRRPCLRWIAKWLIELAGLGAKARAEDFWIKINYKADVIRWQIGKTK